MCRSNFYRSLCHIAIYQETILFFGKRMFSPILADMEGCCNKVFSSQAMSHCYKLRYHTFGASFFLRFSLHLIQIFVFIIPQYRRGDFITKREQFIQTIFFKPYCHWYMNCLPWWPSHSPGMHLSYQGCFFYSVFKYFDIFLRGSYTVNMLLKTSLFWTFWTF